VGKGLNEHVCQPGNPQDGLHIARNPERSGLEAPFFEVYRNKQTYYSGLVSIDEAQIFLDPLGTDVRPGRRRSPLRTQKDLLPPSFGRLDCSLARTWNLAPRHWDMVDEKTTFSKIFKWIRLGPSVPAVFLFGLMDFQDLQV
jgi:hypothetical protein